MSDLRTRKLERRAACGDPLAGVELQRERERACLYERVEVEDNTHELVGTPRSHPRISVRMNVALMASLRCQDCEQLREFSGQTMLSAAYSRYGPVKSTARMVEAPDGTPGVRWQVSSGYRTLMTINSWAPGFGS